MNFYRTPDNRIVPHFQATATRRDFLARAGGGFGALAAAYLLGGKNSLADEGQAQAKGLEAVKADSVNPLAPRKGHYPGTAKSVIFLFMEGGPSHIDLFDPKPLLNKLAGQPLPDSFGSVLTAMGESRSPLLASKREWKQCGKAGTWMSDWIPHHAD